MKTIALLSIAVLGVSAPALADTPSAAFAVKKLPWPAGSKAALERPEKFFPLTPATHVQPLARVSAHALPRKAGATPAGMTEEQARQLLSVYPVHP